jgi:hypothetical protein
MAPIVASEVLWNQERRASPALRWPRIEQAKKSADSAALYQKCISWDACLFVIIVFANMSPRPPRYGWAVCEVA